jgi:hypothetical protein
MAKKIYISRGIQIEMIKRNEGNFKKSIQNKNWPVSAEEGFWEGLEGKFFDNENGAARFIPADDIIIRVGDKKFFLAHK